MFITYKGSLPSYVTVMSVSPPIKAPVSWSTLSIPGMAGVLLTDKIVEPVVIPVKFLVEGKDHEEYLRNCEDFADWLDSEKPEPFVVSDNVERTYYAVTQGAYLPDNELNVYCETVVEFFVPDGRKWGPEKTSPFVNGAANIYNRGTLPVKPTVYAEVLQDLTHLDVLAGEKYMRIGKNAANGQAVVNAEDLVFHSPLTNLTGWSYAGVAQVDGGIQAGSFVNSATDGGGFGVNDFGSGAAWHGPVIKQAIPQAPLVDWEVIFECRFPKITDKTGRAECYLLSDTGQAIGKLALVNSLNSQWHRLEIRIGGGGTYKFLASGVPSPVASRWNGAHMYVRLKRKGDLYSYYAARIGTGGRHESPIYGTFRDEEGLYLQNLSQIQLHTGVWGTESPAGIVLLDVKVKKLNTVPVGDPRVIAKVGDFIEFNFKDSAIYINGEERKDLKDMFASFFTLPRGNSTLAIYPSIRVNAVAVIREGFK